MRTGCRGVERVLCCGMGRRRWRSLCRRLSSGCDAASWVSNGWQGVGFALLQGSWGAPERKHPPPSWRGMVVWFYSAGPSCLLVEACGPEVRSGRCRAGCRQPYRVRIRRCPQGRSVFSRMGMGRIGRGVNAQGCSSLRCRCAGRYSALSCAMRCACTGCCGLLRQTHAALCVGPECAGGQVAAPCRLAGSFLSDPGPRPRHCGQEASTGTRRSGACGCQRRFSLASMHSVAWGTFISRSRGMSVPVVLQMP